MVPGPCQLRQVVDGHAFEDSKCHTYCKLNFSECGGVCNTTGNCSCMPTKVKEVTLIAYCPWGTGLDPNAPTNRFMPFLLALECGCVCTGGSGVGETDAWEGPIIVSREEIFKHPC